MPFGSATSFDQVHGILPDHQNNKAHSTGDNAKKDRGAATLPGPCAESERMMLGNSREQHMEQRPPTKLMTLPRTE